MSPRPDPITPEEDDYLQELAPRLLLALGTRKRQEARELISDVFHTRGLDVVYGCMWAVALAATHMRPDGTWVEDRGAAQLTIVRAATGQLVEPEEVLANGSPEARGSLAAGRFLTMAANNDAESAVALFNAIDSEAVPEFMEVLLELAENAVATAVEANLRRQARLL